MCPPHYAGPPLISTCAIHRAEIDKKVKESIKTRVNIEVADWGQSAETKRFVENLRKMVEENTFLHQEAQVKLDNS